MKINDEGTSNAAHWHERAMKAESRLAEAEALLVEGTRFPMLTGERADWLIRARDWLGPKRAPVSASVAQE